MKFESIDECVTLPPLRHTRALRSYPARATAKEILNSEQGEDVDEGERMLHVEN